MRLLNKDHIKHIYTVFLIIFLTTVLVIGLDWLYSFAQLVITSLKNLTNTYLTFNKAGL